MTPPLPYLASNLQRARPILFTGAGFSLGVTNLAGMPVPSSNRLLELIWGALLSRHERRARSKPSNSL
jgi:hypothetical protein